MQIGLIDYQVINHQDINVDDAVVIFTIHRLQGSAHLSLYALSCLQHLAGCHSGENQHAGVDEVVGRRIAPWLGFIKSRLAIYHANLLSYLFYRLANVALTVAQIRAEA